MRKFLKILKIENPLPDNNTKDNINYYEKAFNIIEDNLIQDKKDEYKKRKKNII